MSNGHICDRIPSIRNETETRPIRAHLKTNHLPNYMYVEYACIGVDTFFKHSNPCLITFGPSPNQIKSN